MKKYKYLFTGIGSEHHNNIAEVTSYENNIVMAYERGAELLKGLQNSGLNINGITVIEMPEDPISNGLFEDLKSLIFNQRSEVQQSGIDYFLSKLAKDGDDLIKHPD